MIPRYSTYGVTQLWVRIPTTVPKFRLRLKHTPFIVWHWLVWRWCGIGVMISDGVGHARTVSAYGECIARSALNIANDITTAAMYCRLLKATAQHRACQRRVSSGAYIRMHIYMVHGYGRRGGRPPLAYKQCTIDNVTSIRLTHLLSCLTCHQQSSVIPLSVSSCFQLPVSPAIREGG